MSGESHTRMIMQDGKEEGIATHVEPRVSPSSHSSWKMQRANGWCTSTLV